ncbi:hypothetical protein PENSTE_c001G03779 [Penicillium steckii]|uniref:Zn(2)-C6 fungal-type domain-containing protein n=1 Tax=Penicillium steckii TaxID=303698 RepID=A0A1V6U147_9EURO|nr:hypothetical protein PENSTE_c001G03779 [Penicillium steckii]
MNKDGLYKSQRSCDRCHHIKERCEWLYGDTECIRCVRLGHLCQTLRPVKKSGRPPQSIRTYAETLREDAAVEIMAPSGRASSFVVTTPKQINPEAPITLSMLSRKESDMFQDMLFRDEVCDTFLLGKSFREDHRQTILSSFLLATPMVSDGILACCLAWMGQRADLLVAFRHASTALSILNSTSIDNVNDAATCTFLGSLLHTFSIRVKVSNIPGVCRRTLVRIKPFYEVARPTELGNFSMLPCLIITELFECWLVQQAPTLRYRPTANKEYVDRFVGLSTSLLPLLHDICELSNTILYTDEEGACGILLSLTLLEQAVNEWQPPVSDDLFQRFDGAEVSCLITQAQSLRLAALLLIHRLRHPSGTSDEPTVNLALSILKNLELNLSLTNKSIKHMELPVVVACYELRPKDRQLWLDKIPAIMGMPPEFTSRLQQIIQDRWEKHDRCQVLNSLTWNPI